MSKTTQSTAPVESETVSAFVVQPGERVILGSMAGGALTADFGPFTLAPELSRYRESILRMVAAGKVRLISVPRDQAVELSPGFAVRKPEPPPHSQAETDINGMIRVVG